MIKVLLDTNQVPELKGRLPGERIKITFHATIDSAVETESGYWRVMLDVERVSSIVLNGYDTLDVTPHEEGSGDAA